MAHMTHGNYCPITEKALIVCSQLPVHGTHAEHNDFEKAALLFVFLSSWSIILPHTILDPLIWNLIYPYIMSE